MALRRTVRAADPAQRERSRASHKTLIQRHFCAVSSGRPQQTASERGVPTLVPGGSLWARLFNASERAILVVEADSGCIAAANVAAAVFLGAEPADLAGTPFLVMLDPSSRERLESSLTAARAGGQAASEQLRLASRGRRFFTTLSSFRTGHLSYVVVHLSDSPFTSGTLEDAGALDGITKAIEESEVGFLIADGSLRISYANDAFLKMVGLDPADDVRGHSLERLLSLSQAAIAGLREQMLRREAVTLSTASARAESAAEAELELCAVAVPEGEDSTWGFCLCRRPGLN